MLSIPDLWMPIVAASIFVFLVSSILHMVFKYHHKDIRPLKDEEAILDKLRAAGVSPGLYSFPYCGDHKDLGKPEMKAKFERGPVGMMTVWPSGPPNMGKYLGLWFAYIVLVSIFVAYLAGRTLPVGKEYLEVFRFAGTLAFMAYVARARGQLDLEGPAVERHLQGNLRRPALLAGHRRHFRLAMASLNLGPQT